MGVLDICTPRSAPFGAGSWIRQLTVAGAKQHTRRTIEGGRTWLTSRRGKSRWEWWVRFAVVLLILNGLFDVLQAFFALIGSNSYSAVVEGSTRSP